MAQYYGESQWPGAGQAVPPPQSTWDHQTPPPPRSSGANSVVPREDSAAFSHQIEEVERAIDNLVKSGKMFLPPGRHGRVASGHHGPRHSMEFAEPRSGGHSGPNLQNFYAAQRHQSSRGSNEAEQMMQVKRRMAAQRERDLRNYHQEQQYNRNTVVDMSYNGKSDRALSPGSLSEDERRDLIQRQRNALYGDGQYDDATASRGGAPGLSTTSSQRGPSPLAFDYGRPAPTGAEGVSQPGDSQALSRANSNASPQSNPPNNIGAIRTSSSSPTGGSPPRAGSTSRPGQTGSVVAPIGTRPSVSSQATNPALTKSSTTPLPSPLSHGVSASGNGDENNHTPTSGASANPASASADGYNGWGNRSGVWGNKSSLGVQASVWG
ncbi:hypothetical protein F5B22DRAFT_643263 [Xylaria bambusicola]|uniref:uncharacterized protein n=1 Tax=Xylaria bambusicola TaxID=326684 RepID=UPI002007C466|nr:uncharacterized protein F5B22DRAFT_643263 [Xylaria bambusicola]KAI0522244.1 hypothetical protein F5B22DRAFT_643263 [Xylaria bambusicola]